jgi:hypothetical protein
MLLLYDALYEWWCITVDAMMVCNKQRYANVQREVVVLTKSLDPVLLLMEDCTSNCELK